MKVIRPPAAVPNHRNWTTEIDCYYCGAGLLVDFEDIRGVSNPVIFVVNCKRCNCVVTLEGENVLPVEVRKYVVRQPLGSEGENK